MRTEMQKLELITWIASIDDKGLLEKLFQVKKTLEPKKASRKATGADSSSKNNEAVALLEKITDAYAASNEPDLNVAQLFADRTKTNGRDIDFN